MGKKNPLTRSKKKQIGELLRSRRLPEAKALLTRVCELDRTDVESWAALASVHAGLRAFGEAEACCRHVLEHTPNAAEAWLNLASVCAAQAKPLEALEYCRRAVTLKPNLPGAHYNLGNALCLLGQQHEAITAYRTALQLDPGFLSAWVNLGGAYKSQGRLDEAVECNRRILALDASSMEARLNLASALAEQGRCKEAVAMCQAAVQERPTFAPAHFNLGHSLSLLGHDTEAAASYREAVRLKPDFWAAWLNLGALLRTLRCYQEAVECNRHIITHASHYIDAYNNLAVAYLGMGMLQEAVTALRQALERKPDFPAAHNTLLFTLNNDSGYTPEQVFAEHVRWSTQFHPGEPVQRVFHNTTDSERRLRVGFVSADFRDHSVAYFLEQPFRHHDRDRLEFFAYADVSRPDAATERLREQCEQWRDATRLSDDALVTRIVADEIDILVDLAGHTAKSRLGVFAQRAAPIQITYLGYPNTTGLRAMDYRLTDAWSDPPGETDRFYTERLVRLPRGFLCYAAPSSPEVNAPPARANGYVTFGSFNSLAKVTDEVVATWAEILRALPSARLVLKNFALGDAAVHEHCARRFESHGIARARLDLRAPVHETFGHLAEYGRVDIALDSFPYNGTTTTCEALWMGVPTITLAGKMHAARVGVSLLRQVGLEDWIAASKDDYLRLACMHARDIDRLAALRAELRVRMQTSPLCDGPAFARDLEQALRGLWRDWCLQPGKSGA